MSAKAAIDAITKMYTINAPLIFTYPKHFTTDRGSNFIAVEFTDFITSKGSEIVFTAAGEKPGLGIINRAQETIERDMFNWMGANKTDNWDLCLNDTIKKYNNSRHNFVTGIGVPEKIQSGETLPYLKDFSNLEFSASVPKFNVGDRVRQYTRRPQSGARRATDQTYTTEIFTIASIRQAQPGKLGCPPEPITYALKNKDGQLINNLYEEEICKA